MNKINMGRYSRILLAALIVVMTLFVQGMQAHGMTQNESKLKASDGAVLADIEGLARKLSPETQRAMLTAIKGLTGDVTIETRMLISKTDRLEIDGALPVLPETSTVMAFINADVNRAFLQAQLDVEASVRGVSEQSHPYSLQSSYEVFCNEGGLLCLVTEISQYTGGAHGMTLKNAYNVDIAEQRLLHLGDFFPGRSDHLSDIKKEIIKAINTEPDLYFPDAVQTVENWVGDLPFYVKGNNVVIFFHPYDLAPYAGGFREFEIPWDVLPRAEALL